MRGGAPSSPRSRHRTWGRGGEVEEMVERDLIVGGSVLIALIFVAIVAVYANRYKKVPPDAAMILYGREYAKGRGYEVWTGGGKFIIPIVESYRFLPLGIRA